jgi:hypothetical protein
METAIRLLAQFSYAVTAALMLLLGAGVLLAGAGLFPGLQSSLLDEAEGNLGTLHILQEFASLLVLAGLVTIWFVAHYEQSMAFHWAMTLFLLLIALVHWFDVRGTADSATGYVVIALPFCWFMVVGLLRWSNKRRGDNQAHGT